MRKNKLMISAITLAFAVVAVVSTTFAWFTMNTETKVENLDFSAQSSTGLYMSLDGSNWKTSLTKDDFAAYAATNADNIKGYGKQLNPVTLLKDGKTFANHKNVTVGEGFVQFVINFKCDVETAVKVSGLTVESKKDSTISLTYNNTDKNQTATDKYWKEYDKDEGSGATDTVDFTTKLANAARVSLTGDKVTAQYIDPSIQKDGKLAGYGGIATDLSTSISHQYLKHISPSDADDVEKCYTENDLSQEIYTSYAALKDETLLTLTGTDEDGYTGSVTVTLWVEGFDQDCFDVLFNSSLILNLTFVTTEVTQAPQQQQ